VATAAGCPRVIRIASPDELPDALSGTVAVTAGASAPEGLIQAVIERLNPSSPPEVVSAVDEDEYFPPPRELRDLIRASGAGLEDDRATSASSVLAELGRA